MLGGYKQLEWIESAGNGYVITDLVPTREWGFDIDFVTNNTIGTSGYGCILGVRVNSEVNDYQFTTYSATGYGGSLRLGTAATPIVGLVSNERIQCSLRDGVFTRPDGTTVEVPPTGDAPTYPVAVFGLNQSSSVGQIGKGRLYSLSMYDGSRWVHYVPAMRVSDSKYGLYNWNDDVFLAATGTITGGAVVAQKFLDNIGLSYFWKKIKEEMRINEKSVSGSVASFDGASSLPVKSLSVNIDPVQAGSGDPSPENVRPISGWDGVNVTVTGKNLYPVNITDETFYNNGGATHEVDGEVLKITTGTGPASGVYVIMNISTISKVLRLLGNEVRNISFDAVASVSTPVRVTSGSGTNITIGTTKSRYSVPSTGVNFSFYTISTPSVIEISNFQIELGSDATAYEPYKGTVYPISLPSTVYGGVLDVGNGTLTVTKKMMTFNGSETWFLSGKNAYVTVNDMEKIFDYTNAISCDKLKTSSANSSSMPNYSISGYRDSTGGYPNQNWIYIRLASDAETVDAIKAWLTENPITVVYPLATPLTINLTPTEVRTILGYNNIYADSGNVDVVYYKDNIVSSNDGFFGAADKEKLDRLNLPVLQTKEYTGIIGSANDAAGATFYFANIVPDDYYKQWKVHYRVTASVPGQNAYNQVSEVTLIGDQNVQRSYRGENSNTGTRPYLYNALYRATSAGCNNGYGHALGVDLRGSTNPTSASYPRTFVIELLGYEGCTVTLWDEMKKYASIPGTGSTNYSGLTENDGYNNGYKQTGDNNYYDRTYVANFNPKAGAGGLKQYALFMEDFSGSYQSLTTTSGTGTSKTKNTAGFKPGRIWCLSSSSNFASGASVGANMAYIIFPFDARYSFNLTANLTAHEPVYLVGTIGSDGLFYLDDIWHTQTLPTTEDGKMYIYLGLAYSANGVHLAPDHPMYWYKNGAVRLWPDGMEGASSAVSGVKGNAETTYRTGNVNLTPANIGAVAKTGDTITGDLYVRNTSDAATVVKVSHGEHNVSLYANDEFVGLYSADKSGMVIYEDTTGDKQLKPVATTSNNGFMSAADKTKLNGIGANAQPVTGMAADGSAPSVDSGTTFVDLETGITLAAGHRYLFTYIVQWSSNASGRRAAKVMIGTSEAGAMSWSTVAPANGAATVHGATFWIQSSTSARTLKIQGYQNSGSKLTATVRYQLIDFGTA